MPPANSPLHDLYNIFFQKVETEISQFSQFAEIYLIGDMNARAGNSCDYIDHDSFLSDFDDDSISLDAPLRRSSMDTVVTNLVSTTCLTFVKLRECVL